MKLYILFGHRFESYEGQYAPEALEVVDECTMDENSEWIYEKKKKYEETGDFDILKIMVVHIDNKTFDRLFFEIEALEGSISTPMEEYDDKEFNDDSDLEDMEDRMEDLLLFNEFSDIVGFNSSTVKKKKMDIV